MTKQKCIGYTSKGLPTPSVSVNASIAACIGIHCDAWESITRHSQASQCMPIQAAMLVLMLTLGVGTTKDILDLNMCEKQNSKVYMETLLIS